MAFSPVIITVNCWFFAIRPDFWCPGAQFRAMGRGATAVRYHEAVIKLPG
jgi:hypothetical protein